jgi:hypothetical protein
MVNNIFHETKTNFTAGENYAVDINEDKKRQIDNKPFNFLVIYNGSDKMILAQLNEETNERIPVPASGGRTVIEHDDQVFFHSLRLINSDGANAATGTVYTTYGRL